MGEKIKLTATIIFLILMLILTYSVWDLSRTWRKAKMMSNADLHTTYGITYSDVMKEMGVNKSSIYNWKRKSPKVLEICIEHTKKVLGKTKVIEEVPDSQMYKNYMISSSKEKDGYYVIWRNGEMIRKTPKSIDECKSIVDGMYKRSL